MYTYTHRSLEHRLLSFKGAESSPNREGFQITEIKREEQKEKGVRRGELNGILGLNEPHVQKLAAMSDDEYRNALLTGKADDVLPATQEEKDCKQAMDGFMREMEQLMNGANQKDLANMNFERLFAGMGRAMDRHIKPLLVKYKGREQDLVKGLAGMHLRDGFLHDQETLRLNPAAKVTNKARELHAMLDEFSDQSYDRVLQKELKDGKSLASIRLEYQQLATNPGKHNEDDAKGMLKAIDNFEGHLKTVQKKLLHESVLRKLPEGVTFSLDLEDGEVVMDISEEAMAKFVKTSLGVHVLPNENIEMNVEGTRYEIRRDKREGVYEIVL